MKKPYPTRFIKDVNKTYGLDPPYSKDCSCLKCLEEDYDEREEAGTLRTPFSHPIMGMITCSECGLIKCPHALNHNEKCIGTKTK